MSVNEKMTALADAIRAKSGATGKLSLDGMTTAVNSITVGGGGSADFYKCASVDASNKTWTGYKAVLADGVYSFEDAVTEGLIYGGGLTPAVKGIYDDGALIEVSKLYQGVYLPGIRTNLISSGPLSLDLKMRIHNYMLS